MKAYDFVFAKTHGANRWRKSSPLANRFAFAGRARPPLLLRFLSPARNPSLRPSNLSLPSRPYFSLLFLIFFLIISKTIQELKTSPKKKKKNALTKIFK
jgi:hypothetical protein